MSTVASAPAAEAVCLPPQSARVPSPIFFFLLERIDTDGIERDDTQTAIRGSHVPVAQIGIYLSAKIRAKETNSSNSIREFYPRIHVPQELARVPFFGKVPEGQAS